VFALLDKRADMRWHPRFSPSDDTSGSKECVEEHSFRTVNGYRWRRKQMDGRLAGSDDSYLNKTVEITGPFTAPLIVVFRRGAPGLSLMTVSPLRTEYHSISVSFITRKRDEG
jgi:hypothetical protein